MDVEDELTAWLEATWDPGRSLRLWWALMADEGWSQPQWPTRWGGRGLSPAETDGVTRIVRDAGAVTAPTGFGCGMAAPTLLAHGTDEQRARHLRGMQDGTDAFCQLFSEPGAGSDLAGLACRAERDGDGWVVNGQKVWTSGGRIANKAMLVARTNLDVPKHAGISYFFLDMLQAGVEVRPLREMTGRSFFNQVFLTDARIPADDLIGGEGNGWAVAGTTLAFERALSGGGEHGASAEPGPLAGNLDQPAGRFTRPRRDDQHAARPTASARLADLARRMGRAGDPLVRDGLARLVALERVTTWNSQRGHALQARGGQLPGLANLAKMSQNHAVRLARDLTFQILGAAATLHGYDPEALAIVEAATGIEDLGAEVELALFAQAPPIYGGSDQIQRNIVGDRVLGLPREPAADRGIPYRDLPRNG